MWPNPQETADLVTFTEEILNKKLHFLCSDCLEYADTVSLNSILNLKKYLMGEVFHWGNSPGKFSGGDWLAGILTGGIH